MTTQRLQPRNLLRSSLAGLALCVALLAPGLANAGQGGDKGHGKLDRVCAKVECSDQQRAEIDNIFKQMRSRGGSA